MNVPWLVPAVVPTPQGAYHFYVGIESEKSSQASISVHACISAQARHGCPHAPEPQACQLCIYRFSRAHPCCYITLEAVVGEVALLEREVLREPVLVFSQRAEAAL